MGKRRIAIKNGEVCGFADEVSFKGLDIKELKKKRVSRIVPANFFLMFVFNVVRGVCKDESRLAAWTRRWRCLWAILIDGKAYGSFNDRAAAIRFEKEKVYECGKILKHSRSASDLGAPP